MNKNLLIAGGVVLALILILPLLAALKGMAFVGVDSAPAGASASGSPDAAIASAPMQAPLLTAENLVGSAWNVSGYTINLGAGGVATAALPFGQVQGTWSINGATITVRAMNKTVTGTISGDQILIDGKPATRVQ